MRTVIRTDTRRLIPSSSRIVTSCLRAPERSHVDRCVDVGRQARRFVSCSKREGTICPPTTVRELRNCGRERGECIPDIGEWAR
jgi:hypothetical protein